MKAKIKSDEAAKRRVRAARLLQAGHKPADVAKRVGAPRQTVYRWKAVLEAEGIDALRDMSKGGRPPLLGAEELVKLQIALMEGPTAHGFGTPLWTIKRVRVFIERTFKVRYSDVHVWRLLGQMGFPARGRNGARWNATRKRSRDGEAHLAGAKKKPAERGD